MLITTNVFFYLSLRLLTCLPADDFKEGDIIFQQSTSSQSLAIQAATHSPYSHCGLITKRRGVLVVYEAVQPVKYTPLLDWIARGKGKHYVVRRLKQAERILTPSVLQKLRLESSRLYGRDYDLVFGWSDRRIYCSELIWKIYQRATGLELGKLQSLKTLDLSAAPVRKKLIERYGNHIPLDEPIITPAAIFGSPLLQTVKEQ
ncbi:Permuted papain-like amidase enzyme, YaeF/YiiX, C92 family [bacterium A37T11]|nr:Permuted papain-like amidase enzyme, YaeF/YiiX, C92 family [bacterium A37T11]